MNRQSWQILTYELLSDLAFGVGFGLLAVASAMTPASGLSLASAPLVMLGLFVVFSGGILRILAGQSLPTLPGSRR